MHPIIVKLHDMAQALVYDHDLIFLVARQDNLIKATNTTKVWELFAIED